MFRQFRDLPCIFHNIKRFNNNESTVVNNELNCTTCTKNAHYCPKCDKFNAHLDIHCSTTAPESGKYECDTCGAKNHHTKENCPYTQFFEFITDKISKQKKSFSLCTQPSSDTTYNVNILIPIYKVKSKQYVACHIETKGVVGEQMYKIMSCGGLYLPGFGLDVLNTIVEFAADQDGICNISQNNIKFIKSTTTKDRLSNTGIKAIDLSVRYSFHYYTVSVNLNNFNE